MKHFRAVTVARAQDDDTNAVADILQGINTILSTTFDFILSVLSTKTPDETAVRRVE
jgi:hypothetical protein